MYNIIKNIFETIGFLFSLLLPTRLPELLKGAVTHMYTGFLRRRFAHFGQGSIIEYKATDLCGLDCVSIGNHTQILKGGQLTAWKEYKGTMMGKPEIIIGDYCQFNEHCHITAVGSIRIGNHLLTGANVLITDNSHGLTDISMADLDPKLRPLSSKGPVVIGNNVWLGKNVCVMPGVTIGDGAVIGANSVVTKNIPSYSVAAGVPARVIKQMNNNQ